MIIHVILYHCDIFLPLKCLGHSKVSNTFGIFLILIAYQVVLEAMSPFTSYGVEKMGHLWDIWDIKGVNKKRE